MDCANVLNRSGHWILAPFFFFLIKLMLSIGSLEMPSTIDSFGILDRAKRDAIEENGITNPVR